MSSVPRVRMKPLSFAAIFLFYSMYMVGAHVVAAQTSSSPAPSASNVVGNQVQTLPSITFSSTGPVSNVQMTGTANWTYGSDQRSGTILLQASAAGQSRMEFQVATGTRVETQNPFTDAARQRTWTGFDGIVHTNAPLHC